MRDTPIFVARDEELARLDHFLNKAMLGQGQICFVTADAGSGKTTLTTEFARLAQERHDDLIVAVGLCDPQIGVGNPYLPFREMLGTLTGTLQSRQTAAATSDENTDRLQNVLRTSGNLLLEYGPDLIGTFVPGASLVTSIGLNVAQKAGWLSQSGGTDSAVEQPDFQGVDQNQIF